MLRAGVESKTDIPITNSDALPLSYRYSCGHDIEIRNGVNCPQQKFNLTLTNYEVCLISKRVKIIDFLDWKAKLIREGAELNRP